MGGFSLGHNDDSESFTKIRVLQPPVWGMLASQSSPSNISVVSRDLLAAVALESGVTSDSMDVQREMEDSGVGEEEQEPEEEEDEDEGDDSNEADEQRETDEDEEDEDEHQSCSAMALVSPLH
ncbi:hypothetical protein ONZ51_g10962 [Trametes cubensis]|uniref:Uncharacterized protein n=1 Tax=Trametes cubensis TaxID=1111947 RepID=A0AAD7TIJ2_9APHY|nr:hypothetical protein ONZ51_g10962 [Trametes cubensis]